VAVGRPVSVDCVREDGQPRDSVGNSVSRTVIVKLHDATLADGSIAVYTIVVTPIERLAGESTGDTVYV